MKPVDRGRAAGELLESALRGGLSLSSGVLDLLARDYVNAGDGPLLELQARDHRHRKVRVPKDLVRDLEELAREQGTSVAEVMRRFLSLGLYVSAAQRSSGAILILRQGEQEREIVWL